VIKSSWTAEVITVKSYDKSTDVIDAKVGEIFSVELESVPGAGYQWEADISATGVELVEKQIAPPDRSTVGGSSKEVFKLKATAAADDEIRFIYKRPWENSAAETVTIKLHAK
jgi:predicted secreted protein